MNNLPHTDVQKLLTAVVALHSAPDVETLSKRTLEAVGSLFSADLISFDGFGSNDEFTGSQWHSRDDLLTPESLEVFSHVYVEHPLLAPLLVDKHPGTLKISDFAPDDRFHRMGIYNEFFRRVGLGRQMITAMQITPDLVISCAVSRDKKDFTDEECLLLTLLAPHLTNAIRNARAFEQIRQSEHRLMSIFEKTSNGMIALNADMEVQYMNVQVKALLEKYFVGETWCGNGLPDSLELWIGGNDLLKSPAQIADPPLPFVLERENSLLKISLIVNSSTGEKTLLLEEKIFLTPSALTLLDLTKREAEILYLMGQGKTDGEIALLCEISQRTVQKHAEHIYQKLGVETRNAAVLRAISILERVLP